MSAVAAIPIENVYYLFCYAWDRFEEGKSVALGGEASPDLPNLLARVLANGTRMLIRRGLDRNYQRRDEEISTVRGTIELGPTMRLYARRARKIHCIYDELSYDTPHNRVLKASLKRLSKARTLDPKLGDELPRLAAHFSSVRDILLSRASFARIQLHRNNGHYDLLLRVSELAFECLLPEEDGTGFRFQDVTRDEAKMARVFEAFVRNFYRQEQRTFSVEPLQLRWDAERCDEALEPRLPQMRVDVFLRNAKRRIIIDTKYYANALQTYYGTESLHSGNLYQLFSYLRNAAGTDPAFATAEGILLYPQVQRALNASFVIQGHPVRVATVDLATPWKQIEARLLNILNLER